MNTRSPRPAIIEGSIARLPLGVGAKDGYALVDEEFSFLDRLKWHFDGRYAATRLSPSNKKIRLHHMIVGKNPGMDVDHINQKSLDNRRANLRVISHADNLRNNKAVGAYLDKRDNAWFSEIKINGKYKYLGRFKTPDEASAAFAAAKQELWELLG